MPCLQFDNIGFAALACAVPAHVQKADEDPNRPDAAYIRNFIRQIGVRQRHISVTEQTCLDTGYAAACRALEKAGWLAADLDGVLFMSQTPDFNAATGNAHLLQYRLGMRTDTLAFDITLGCSSFPYGLSVCASLLQQENIHKLLMVSGDTMWGLYASRDELCSQGHFLEGEGTTALLLERAAKASPIRIDLHTDGSGYRFLYNPRAGWRNQWRRFAHARTCHGVEIDAGRYMDGLEITSFATTTVVDSIRQFLTDNHTTLDTYDGLVLHQANRQILRAMAKRLGIAAERVPLSLDRYGNTNAASVPLTMLDAYANDPRDELHLLCCAFGIGLSWGIVDLNIRPGVMEPIFPLEGGVFEEGLLQPAESK